MKSKLKINGNIWFAAVVIGAFLCNRYSLFITYDSFRGLECFFIGCLLCGGFEFSQKIFLQKLQRKKTLVATLSVIAMIVITVSFIISLDYSDQSFLQRRIVIIGVFPELMFIMYLFKDSHNRLIHLSGKISFEMFIWHGTFLCLVRMVADAADITVNRTHFSMILFTAGVFLISAVFYQYIEVPIGKILMKKTDVRKRAKP